jgi:hypothetical protein
MADDDDRDEGVTMAISDAEMNGLLGLFDLPAFVRRGQDLEYALARIHARCQRERTAMLDMVRVRLKQWSGAAAGPGGWDDVFVASIEPLWPQCSAEPPAWSDRPAPRRKQRAIARDLVASVTRFNRRWTEFLAGLGLEHANRMIDDYNRYYLLEKECSLGSARLAARYYSPKPRLTVEGLLADYPPLAVPELRAG